ncbi:MAG: response regulator [Phycisphaeraceae bacterium]|nr:response regulator [Phycisphaeraceae bacterium]
MSSKPITNTTGGRPHVMVVEDEQDLQDLLRYNLSREGMEVLCTDSGERALELARQKLPDLILLDLMLPGVDGLNVCRTLKSEPATAGIPVVMLTAKGEEADIVVGLELGADDYITKPFSPRILMARIKAVLRRAAESQAVDDQDDDCLTVGEVTIDRGRHEIRIEDEAIDLTVTEFRLLNLLATRPGRVFTRQQIIEAIHGGLAAVTDRSVDVQMVALRRKLGDQGSYLETVRGVGYRFKD